MLLSLIQLLYDERLSCFSQYPLLNKPLLFRIPTYLQAWGQSTDVLRQLVVQERSLCFYAVSHLRTITQEAKENVRQVPFRPKHT
jgi:hypothetical protein